MKKLIFLFIFFPTICFCQFDEESQIIKLKTHRYFGSCYLDNSFGDIPERNINCSKLLFPKTEGIPDTLQNINEFITTIDFEQASYQAYFNRDSNSKFSMNYIFNFDTCNCHKEYVKTFICIVTGKTKDGKTYYCIDTDNDLSYKREKLYIWDNVDINRSNKIHKILFERFQDNKIIVDSLLIKIGTDPMKKFYKREDNNRIGIKILEYRIAEFQYNNDDYGMDKYTIKEIIRIINVNFRL